LSSKFKNYHGKFSEVLSVQIYVCHPVEYLTESQKLGSRCEVIFSDSET